MSAIKIKFLGAAGTVTGSKHLISAYGKNILIDCGLFQGLKELRLLNWEPLTFPADQIDMVLLTHGHLDHTGYLPRLVKEGFSGNIIGTSPTLQITEIILKDSAKIQEEDTVRANKFRYSRHHPALPLYNLDDVEKTLPLFRSKPLNDWQSINENIRYRFRYNGHIIGATFIEMEVGDKTLVFSGDIGREIDPLLFPPEKPEKADLLFIEATYGDRFHPEIPVIDALQKIINRCTERNGTIIIPSFSVERTQLLMYLFWQLNKSGKMAKIPIYMDSPMSRNVLEVFHQNRDWHKLSPEEYYGMCDEISFIGTVNETLALAKDSRPKIIIAGSGMAAGGRVLTYFAKYLGDANATIMLVGFQAEGTRGRALLEGAKEIKLYGKYFTVRATIENMEGLSAHADQNGLIDWMSKLAGKPERIFIVHAEKEGAEGLQHQIKTVYDWDAEIPALNDHAEITVIP
ncbi:MBL fold metallo-hydrolase RNA specificity domain-containing protein [Chryseobacterium sp. MDT2-18]|uniref:MBL fold metallo-hydrolase RNA specificity domain-containing protein n=1 Tax=Chryseobacterium sp. MDT2-18 TaxID=1259136 RepID=UPI00278B1E7C|nr:MBL fold metallo-hydrolase [Chryseobacterium sp. MDT2-18]MDQ0477767.1 metallo-beta-lactamase family protein [Chryseobacterium sp. MDT2-18]